MDIIDIILSLVLILSFIITSYLLLLSYYNKTGGNRIYMLQFNTSLATLSLGITIIVFLNYSLFSTLVTVMTCSAGIMMINSVPLVVFNDKKFQTLRNYTFLISFVVLISTIVTYFISKHYEINFIFQYIKKH